MRHGIDVHIEPRDYAMAVDVWFISRPPAGPSLCGYFKDGQLDYVEFDERGPVAPTFTISRNEATALAEALRDERRPDVSADALQDARVVRDRLLTLVESRFGS